MKITQIQATKSEKYLKTARINSQEVTKNDILQFVRRPKAEIVLLTQESPQ